jgi:hypothetical protein
MNFPKNSPWVSYACVFGWTLFIYASVPLVRDFQKFVYRTVGKATFGYFVLTVLAAGFLWSVYCLKKKIVTVRNFLWLAGVASVYGYLTIKLWRVPEEAMHFVEYGVLSYLVYVALSHNFRDVTVYFSAALIVLFLGTVDEIIQWLVPKRFWDFRDVWLNFLSGSLFQLALWKGVQPKNIVEKVNPKSIHILSVTIAANLLLLGLCFSFTPPRIEWISEKLPFISFLRQNEEMMGETGFKHTDVQLGEFYSRFSKEKLLYIDKERQQEHANVLNETVDMKYADFLKIYNPVTAPLLYEMRIHIFRRERYWEKGRKEKEKRKRAELWGVAASENKILEKYFGRTLKRSVYQWSAEKRQTVLGGAKPKKYYESPVSKQLFTSFTEKEVWLAIGSLLGFLLLVNVYIRLRDPNREETRNILI